MNVKSYCPHCNQPMAYDDDYAGVEVDCPSCLQKVFLPKMEPSIPTIPPIVPVPSSNKTHARSWRWVIGTVAGVIILFSLFLGSSNDTAKSKPPLKIQTTTSSVEAVQSAKKNAKKENQINI